MNRMGDCHEKTIVFIVLCLLFGMSLPAYAEEYSGFSDVDGSTAYALCSGTGIYQRLS